MAAGSIIIDLLMKTGSFETDTKRAEKRLAELKKEATAMGVAVGAAFAGVAAASVALVHGSLENMDAVSKMSQMYGIATETLSAMGHAARLADVSQEELAVSLGKLSKAMVEGNDAFKELGVSATRSDGYLKTTDEMLTELADTFAKLPDGPKKTALAMELFGKSGAKLIPLLNGGSAGLADMRKEAEALGVLLDGDVAKAAEEFNDNLTRVHEAVEGIANRATTALLPSLISVSEQFVDMAKDEEAVHVITNLIVAAVDGLITVFQTVVVLGSDVAFVFQGIGREMGAWLAQLDALASFDLKGFNAISEAVTEDGKKARAELERFQAAIMRLGQRKFDDPRLLGPVGSIASQTAGWARAKPNPVKTPKGPKDKDLDADFKSYLDNLQKQIQKTHELNVEEKLLDDIRRGSLTVTPDQQKMLVALAQQIDAEKSAMEVAQARQEQRNKDYEQSIAAARELEEADRAWLHTLTDETPTRQMEQLLKNFERLDRALAEGLDPQVYQEARNKLAGLTEDTRKGKSAAEELGTTFTSALEDAVVAGEDLSTVLKGLLQDLVRIFFRLQVTEPLMEAFKKAGTGSSSGGGSWWGTVLSAVVGAFGGGVTPPNPYAGARAGGGDVLPGRSYDVGEYGRERFVPRTAGTVMPASAMSSTTIINQTTGRVDRAIEQRISPTQRALILQENRAAIIGELYDPNSKLSQAMSRNFTTSRRR